MTRFKNALKDIKNNPDYEDRELGDILKRLQSMAEDVDFWKRQDAGLAVLANNDGINNFRLPYEITEATYIENRLILSPLVVMHSIGTEFYVLDINLTKPRLLKSHQGALIIVNDENMPASFQETISRNEYKIELQHRAAPRGGGGDNTFHAHSPEDTLEQETIQYLSLVADAVDEFLVNQDQPLLLVGEQSRVGHFRPRLKYKNLLPTSINGNFEFKNPHDLYELVIETLQSYEANKRQTLVEKLLASPPELVVAGNEEIAKAASKGRVEQMYVPAYRRTADTVQPGRSESIILQLPSDISELETVIRAVLGQRGSVLAVEIGAFAEVTEAKALCRF